LPLKDEQAHKDRDDGQQLAKPRQTPRIEQQ
jgi:hypothetical protein